MQTPCSALKCTRSLLTNATLKCGCFCSATSSCSGCSSVYAGSAAAPTTKCTMSHHLQVGQVLFEPKKQSRSRHIKCSCYTPPRRKTLCDKCKGGSMCRHGVQRPWCRQCGGSARCDHGRQRSKCLKCGGSGLCSHGKFKCRCSICKNLY